MVCCLTTQRGSLSRDKQQELHSRAQDMMRNHVITSATTHSRQQHRDVLLSRLDMDASLLLSTSSINYRHHHSLFTAQPVLLTVTSL